MRDFRAEIVISAPPNDVWAVMSNFACWREWTPTILGILQLDPGPVEPGVRFLIRQPKSLDAVWRVTMFREGRRFDWVLQRPGVEVVARHFITPVDNGCRVTLTLEFRGVLGGLVGFLARGMTQRYLALEAQGLKNRVESEAAGGTDVTTDVVEAELAMAR